MEITKQADRNKRLRTKQPNNNGRKEGENQRNKRKDQLKAISKSTESRLNVRRIKGQSQPADHRVDSKHQSQEQDEGSHRYKRTNEKVEKSIQDHHYRRSLHEEPYFVETEDLAFQSRQI